tara:strand:+ start:1342 stop:1488 length:147 start_codon:yes stop_codon:yes gene_type:complete
MGDHHQSNGKGPDAVESWNGALFGSIEYETITALGGATLRHKNTSCLD